MKVFLFRIGAFCPQNTLQITFLVCLCLLTSFLNNFAIQTYSVLPSQSYCFIICLWLQSFHSEHIKQPSYSSHYFHSSTTLYLNFCNTWDIFWHTEWDKDEFVSHMANQLFQWYICIQIHIYFFFLVNQLFTINRKPALLY